MNKVAIFRDVWEKQILRICMRNPYGLYADFRKLNLDKFGFLLTVSPMDSSVYVYKIRRAEPSIDLAFEDD